MLKLALLLAFNALHAINPADGHTHPAPAACQEDMACWNCEVMGNQICGPQTGIGTALSADQHGVYVDGSPIVHSTVVVGGITYRCPDVASDSPAWDYCHNPSFGG